VVKESVLVFPELCHGCGACSYFCPEKAITEGRREIGVVESGSSNGLEFAHGKLSIGEIMAPPLIRKVKEQTNSERTVVIDVSPGTSCPVVEAVKGSDFCLLVTEPTPFGLNDLELAIGVTRELKIPCGVVINRAGIEDDKTEKYCLKENVPILLKIPLDIEIAKLYSKGILLVDGMPMWRESFLELFERIKELSNN
jgi:MinD superfamily P-loop ATPase